jgi:UDP-N-acetyl-D-mannosaminuronate dehydrogenase
MPEYVVERLEQILKEKNIAIKRARILVIGVTYKRDIKDLRKSPSIEVIDILQLKNIKVSYFDPLIPYLKLGQINLKSIDLDKNTLKKFDCVVIATDHSSLDYDFLLKNSKLIFDTRNVYRNIKTERVIKL